MDALSIGAFYINMDKDTKRRQRVQSELMKLDMPVQRVPAVNGKSLTDSERRSLTTWTCHLLCTPSMVGCAASHLKAWRAFVDSDFTHAVICEDDIVVQAGCKEQIISAIREVHDDFDILYGGCLHCDPDPGMSWSVTFFNLVTGGKMGNGKARKAGKGVYVPHVALGTHCYVVNRDSALRLIDILRRGIDFHVDVQLNRHFRELKVFAMHPPIARQHFDGDSNNVTTTYPTALNSLVAGWYEGGLPGAYIMSAPAGQLGPLSLNAWLMVCGGIALSLGFYDRRMSVSFPSTPSLLILLLLLTLTIPDMIQGTMSGHWPLPAVTGLLFLTARGSIHR
jgi:GR25 family glycosyltransferase involved in LPS biosynthesis